MAEEKKDVVDPTVQKEETANPDEQETMNKAIIDADRAQNVPIEKTEEKSGEVPEK